MSLSDLASIGSLVSDMAVLISLIYLALQVRQAERNQRAIVQQARISRSSDQLMGLADPVLTRAWLQGLKGAADLSEEETFRFVIVSPRCCAMSKMSIFSTTSGFSTKPRSKTSWGRCADFCAMWRDRPVASGAEQLPSGFRVPRRSPRPSRDRCRPVWRDRELETGTRKSRSSAVITCLWGADSLGSGIRRHRDTPNPSEL